MANFISHRPKGDISQIPLEIYFTFGNAEYFTFMRKEIEIQGCIEVSPEIDIDHFTDEFIKWVESRGWSFGGGFSEIIDGHYIMPDGSNCKHFSDMSKNV